VAADNKARGHVLLKLRRMFDPEPVPPPEITDVAIIDWIATWRAAEEATGRSVNRTLCTAAIVAARLCGRDRARALARQAGVPNRQRLGRPKRATK
jgi:hypothetical protein